MRVAIIHYWLVGMRGGEKVLEALCEMFPTADIFTHVVVPDAISRRLKSHVIKTSFIARLPRAAKMYKSYLPLMPLALENLDLRGYDLVISSESGPAKGIIPPPSCVHICYCHSPMRYIWNMYQDYRAEAGLLTRLAMPILSHYLRSWDESSAARVDHFVANSHTVARRIRKYYRREARVIHPPVAVDDFSPVPDEEVGDYHLMVGELVSYKRPDLAIEAFNRSGRKLVVIGGGEMLKQIRQMAGPTVQVLGPQPFDVLKYHYAHCRGLIFPGEEDFGIIPVEAMASGRPVIAFARGGATETVLDGVTGLLFEEQSVDSLLDAVERLDTMPIDRSAILRQAQRFNPGRFRYEMEAVVNQALAENAAITPVAVGEIGLVPSPIKVGGAHA